MGLWNWVFGKHPPRPCDPNRVIAVAVVPTWESELMVAELAAIGISARSAADVSVLGTGRIDPVVNIYVAETDAAAARIVIDRQRHIDPPEFVLRPTSVADRPFLRQMLLDAVFVPSEQPRPSPEILDDPTLARYVTDFGERAGDVGWVAETPDQVTIGAAWLRLFAADAAGYGFVRADIPELSIAVAEDYRDRGVGSALLVAVLSDARAASLSVDLRSPAINLYERFGFEIVSTTGSSATMLYQPDD